MDAQPRPFGRNKGMCTAILGLGPDGTELTERELGPGLHLVVNSGLASDLWPIPAAGVPGGTRPDTGAGGLTAEQAAAARAHELGRIAHFLPRLQAARTPDPVPGAT